jgi:hypothetical protein
MALLFAMEVVHGLRSEGGRIIEPPMVSRVFLRGWMLLALTASTRFIL